MIDPTARVRAAAAAHGLRIAVRERPDAHSVADAAHLLGIPISHIVKTLVLRRHGGAHVFAMVPGDRAIAWPKLRAVVGVNKLRMPDAAAALAATGYARGTIVPIGSVPEWPVYADERILGHDIALGAGAKGFSVFVDADAFVAAYQATVADITRPASDDAGASDRNRR